MCNCSVLSNCNCNAAHACIVICLFGWNMCNDETSTKSTTTKKYKRTQIAKCNAVKNSSHAGLSIWDAIHICLLKRQWKKEHKLQSAKQLSCWRIHPASLRWLIIEMSAVRWKKAERGERERMKIRNSNQEMQEKCEGKGDWEWEWDWEREGRGNAKDSVTKGTNSDKVPV